MSKCEGPTEHKPCGSDDDISECLKHSLVQGQVCRQSPEWLLACPHCLYVNSLLFARFCLFVCLFFLLTPGVFKCRIVTTKITTFTQRFTAAWNGAVTGKCFLQVGNYVECGFAKHDAITWWRRKRLSPKTSNLNTFFSVVSFNVFANLYVLFWLILSKFDFFFLSHIPGTSFSWLCFYIANSNLEYFLLNFLLTYVLDNVVFHDFVYYITNCTQIRCSPSVVDCVQSTN